MPNFEITPDGHGFIVSGELDLANAREFAAAFREPSLSEARAR
jgi:hypothetical protein